MAAGSIMFGSFDDNLLEKVTQSGHAAKDELRQPSCVQADCDALGTGGGLRDELRQPSCVQADCDALGTGGGLRDERHGDRGGRGAGHVNSNAAGGGGGRRWWSWLRGCCTAPAFCAQDPEAHVVGSSAGTLPWVEMTPSYAQLTAASKVIVLGQMPWPISCDIG